MSRLVPIGKITRAHGLRGEVVVRPNVDGSITLCQQKSALLRFPGQEAREVEIESARGAGETLLIKFCGSDDRTAAEGLAGHEVLLPRESLPALDIGEFYACDLIGLVAKSRSGDVLGKVAELFDAGAAPVFEIEPIGGGGRFQVPLVDQFVIRIDIAAGEVVIEPPIEEEG